MLYILFCVKVKTLYGFLEFDSYAQFLFWINEKYVTLLKHLYLLVDPQELSKVVYVYYMRREPGDEREVKALVALLSYEDVAKALKSFLEARKKRHVRNAQQFLERLRESWRTPFHRHYLRRVGSFIAFENSQNDKIAEHLKQKYRQYVDKVPNATEKFLRQVVYVHYLRFPLVTPLFSVNVYAPIYFDVDKAIENFLKTVNVRRTPPSRWWRKYLEKIGIEKNQYSTFLWLLSQ